jgi:DNA-binding MarR family transcriptional regulator
MNQADGAASTAVQPHFTFSILHAAQAITDRLESAFGSVGLSMAKFSALSKLAESREPLALSELAARLSCVRSNITQLVDRLEADGLVRRVDDPDDRRSVRAELTDRGRERQTAGALEMARVQEELEALVPAPEIAALDSALAALA